jgi:hypothetical protein
VVNARLNAGRLAVIGYLIFAASIAMAFAAIEQSRETAAHQVNRINHAQCASLQNLYAVIRKTITDSERAIDTLDYYKQHPKERADAHMRNRETLQRFKTPPCPPDITVP